MESWPKPTEQTQTVASDSNIFGAEALDASPRLSQSEPPGGKHSAPDATGTTGWHLWAERTSLVVYVVFCIELGMILAVLPWTKVWTENNFVIARPLLRALVNDNFIRGLVTGLGLVDIWFGIREAVHYREPAPKPNSPPPSS